ncbi:hypothetical protein CAPTEDRAFT_182825 [Capitella teleta]|uniref:Protein FAM166B n=1 Tax=Capitella teleta TaxID=283909 RepID=R7UKN5_CAPTE|nr:hypothetical protein CAPTEDRAFT_182825 [Capitella teleta]|eukprot:ELU07069.1 hypothetical protein CAPTEDRAFT_182825 [Capitella teleta]
MTTIATGGGPTLEQRRGFAGLHEGTQVPGYCGYCPQLKYQNGQTYGQDTQDLSQRFPYRRPAAPIAPGFSTKPPIVNRLPKSTGDNKYTEKMVPGYTSYIPGWPFKFGGTYKEDCDVCIDEHISSVNKHKDKMRDLHAVTQSTPQLKPVKFDPEVKDKLNTYRDTHPNRPILTEGKRPWLEAPIPGYEGFIPRIGTTELGLGGRYHVTTGNGLRAFKAEKDFHQSVKQKPINLSQNPGGVKEMGNWCNRRLYLNDGMIPHYTGYVPQNRYRFGQTYGDTTRNLNVCAHPQDSYGDYVRSKPRPLTSSMC